MRPLLPQQARRARLWIAGHSFRAQWMIRGRYELCLASKRGTWLTNHTLTATIVSDRHTARGYDFASLLFVSFRNNAS